MEDWSVVRHKRGSAGRRAPPAANGVAQHLHSSGKKKPLPAGLVDFYPPAPSSESPTSPSATDGASLVTPDDKAEEERLLRKVQRALAKVEQSGFYSSFRKQMQDLEVLEKLSRIRPEKIKLRGGKCGEDDELEVEEDDFREESDEPLFSRTVALVVYGVGSISNSEISRCQLALALLMKQKAAEIGHVVVYDPVMSPLDRSVMLQLGVSPLEDNDEGRRPLDGPTLFYMPHCDVELYESVLLANLKPWSVEQMVILGNSFRTYRDRWSVSPLPQGERPHSLLKVQPAVEEVPVADNFSPTAFNDTSWHFFSELEVSDLP